MVGRAEDTTSPADPLRTGFVCLLAFDCAEYESFNAPERLLLTALDGVKDCAGVVTLFVLFSVRADDTFPCVETAGAP